MKYTGGGQKSKLNNKTAENNIAYKLAINKAPKKSKKKNLYISQ